MHRFERCQSTESMIGDQGGSRKSRRSGTVLGTKSAKRSRRVFHDEHHCLPLPVDNQVATGKRASVNVFTVVVSVQRCYVGGLAFKAYCFHWWIQEVHPPCAPLRDPILSFWHTNFTKCSHLGSPGPPTGNPGSATGFYLFFSLKFQTFCTSHK